MSIAAHTASPVRGLSAARGWPLSGVLFVAGMLLALAVLMLLAVSALNARHAASVYQGERDDAVRAAQYANARLVEAGEQPVPLPSVGGVRP